MMLTLMDLPTPVRVNILNRVSGTQDDLRVLPIVSKMFYKDCKQPGIEWEIVRIFELSPSELGGGRTCNFFHNLRQYQHDPNTNDKLQRYRQVKVNSIDKFEYVSTTDLYRITYNTRMDRIVSLDISLPSPTHLRYVFDCLPVALSFMLPNLREINLSNTNYKNGRVLEKFVERCPRLQKITWDNINDTLIFLSGKAMQGAGNLREIRMDDSKFCYFSRLEKSQMSDLNNYPNIFMFRECNKVLERVSIRNAYYKFGYGHTFHAVS